MGGPGTSGERPRVLFLMGATATGKTQLAVDLVGRLPLEIVSVDSAMVYRGMDIGTATPDRDTLRRAPHRLIDIRLRDHGRGDGQRRRIVVLDCAVGTSHQ